MPTLGVSTGTLDYSDAWKPEPRWWKTALAGIATLVNGAVAAASFTLATRLAPQFGDATSRNGVVVPLVFWKLPLLTVATMLLAYAARRQNKRMGRLSFVFAWCVFAVWAAVALLLFRP